MNYTASWKQLKLDDFVTISGEKRNIRNEQDIHYSIEMNNIESSTGRLISKTKTDKLKGVRNYFDKNQVLFAKLRPYLQKYYYSEQEGVCSTEFWVFDGSTELNNLYLYYLVQTPKFIQSANVSSGTKMPRADWSYMKTVSYYLPPLEEQEKIGRFLSMIDQQINLKEKEIEKQENIKSAYLSEMFPKNGGKYPEKRFAEFTKPWKKYSLSDLGYIVSGSGFPNSEQGGKEGTMFLKVSDMNLLNNSVTINSANNYVSDSQIKKNKWAVISQTPAIIFAKVGAALLLNRKRLVKEKFLIDNNMMAFILGKHLNTEFTNILFKTIYFPQYAQTGALPSMNDFIVEKIEVTIPTLEEQEKIGNLFTNLDQQILIKKNKLAKLKKIKKSYLNALII